MSERKKKPRVTDENVIHAPAEYLSRTSSDNFINFFVTLCEEYDVDPLPKILPLIGKSSAELPGGTARQPTYSREQAHSVRLDSQFKTEISTPLIYVTHERSGESGNIVKIESRGREVSVCMLDALSISIEKFRTVTTIRLPNCRINAFGVSQIAQLIEDTGCVRDLNLDMNPNIRENYYLLCSTSGNLHFLSLKYCNISNTGIERIANELKYRDNKVSHLTGLNLANNRVSDIGAGHIATMLHTNRSLQSLILTGNGITDIGAALMIQELCAYSLTHNEIVDLRRLNYKRLMKNPCIKSHNSIASESRVSESSSRNFSSKRINSKTSAKSRKTTSTRQLVNDKRSSWSIMEKTSEESTIFHPLTAGTRRVKGEMMAVGNFELQHLNLGYNHLTDETLKKIIKCVFYQSYKMLGDASKGLIDVNFEGNDFEIEGNESLNQLRELLSNRVSRQSEDATERE